MILTNLNNWIAERAITNKPLNLNEFVKWMLELGYKKKEISELLTKERRKDALQRYERIKNK